MVLIGNFNAVKGISKDYGRLISTITFLFTNSLDY